uniref:Uncharacterized protein n=1 Tax=Erpetoichthys calabaricus TaxID=27687 RepID=A0A8C4SNM0_ERPCA
VALLMEATLPRTGLAVAIQMAVYLFHRGKLLRTHGALVLFIGMSLVNMTEQRTLIGKNIRTVDALQIRLLGELRVATNNMLLKLLSLAEGLLAIITHEQSLLMLMGERLYHPAQRLVSAKIGSHLSL